MIKPVAVGSSTTRRARLEPVGFALAATVDGARHVELITSAMATGVTRCAASGIEIGLERTDHGDAATLVPVLRNTARERIEIESLTLRFRFTGHDQRAIRYLRHGWQSWSYTAARDLDDGGEPGFPSGEWLRGMYHALGAAPPERVGWHESETLCVLAGSAGGPALLAGVLETGSAFGIVWLRRAAGHGAVRDVEIEVEQRLEVALAPGERRGLEAVRLAVGDDPVVLLERYAELWGLVAGARRASPFQAGWCSWYHFFHGVSEDDVLRNLDAIAEDRSGLPVSVVQLDDGYQRTIGDWLETNERFPRGIAVIAEAIRSAGFRAGLWTAPFAASRESRVLEQHPDWPLRNGEHWLRGSYNRAWSADGWVYALDTSRDDVVLHLESLSREQVEMGFDYLKLDFLYMAAQQGEARDPNMTRAARLRRGLAAIRAGAGDDAFLLGCGCPLGPAVGLVDGMRIGPDVAPSWAVDQPVVIPGLETTLPSTHSALRSTLLRLFMHRRLWLNDPDCLMVRSRDTKLSPVEARTLADVIAVSGGMVVFSDDVPTLAAGDRDLVRDAVAGARAVDAAGSRGSARLVDPLAPGTTHAVLAGLGPDALVCLANLGDAPSEVAFELAAGSHGRTHLVGAARTRERSVSTLRRELAPHASTLHRLPDSRPPAIFCDFDGTFSVRDVGSTLAKSQLAERRAELMPRFDSGELDAWQYIVELFDGFEYSREALDRFLDTIELDPGAAALVNWCAARSVPLRILSDGFDHNLDRLQAMRGVRFGYDANHLRFDGDRWRVSPGHRDRECGCGTGTCKRALIEEYRTHNPGRFCVHIGNGRVSDLCGALAADLVFAKDSLAPALGERGVFHHPFRTLEDVITVLDAWIAAGRR